MKKTHSWRVGVLGMNIFVLSGLASARLLTDALAKVVGQSVVIDNRKGGSGNVAYQAVARANPDGYTMLNSYSTYHVGNPQLTPKLPWAQKDFAPAGTPAALEALVKSDTDFWGKTIQAAGIKAD